MTPSIADFYAGYAEKTLLATQSAAVVTHGQDDFYFRLAALKNERKRSLQEHLRTNRITKLCIGANLGGIDYNWPEGETLLLPKGFFHENDPAEFEQKLELLGDSVVIVNNNDIGHQGGMPYYARFYSRADKTVFIIWDWDNHHWLDLSSFLAVHSDIYAPAHHENLYPLSRCNWLTAGPVYCATVQWSAQFISDHLPAIVEAQRSDTPLGMHIPYSPFRFRMQTIATLASRYPTIGFTDRSFHGRTGEDRLTEWCSHKAHWIVPVLNDVPIRIFDALITGGIPIVPESLRLLPPVSAIPREFIAFYSPHDIIEPERVVAEAIARFDEGRADGIGERHRYALAHHHGETRMKQMLSYLAELGLGPE